MLLEIENQLYKRIHDSIGQSAVVLKLAEEIDKSGKVAEQTMVVVSFTSASTQNPHEGVYVPTVRNRTLNYTVTVVQKQTQRLGHSFALPILDVIADAVTGWVPEICGMSFQTGFELGSERFSQVTEASQFVYEQNYSIQVLLRDGRFLPDFCHPCEEINLCNFLPSRKCLKTPAGVPTGLAVWRLRRNETYEEEWIIEDSKNCAMRPGDYTEIVCSTDYDGTGEYIFTPSDAVSYGINGEEIIDEAKQLRGSISKVWKCAYRDNTQRVPSWSCGTIDLGIWRSAAGKVGDKQFSAKVQDSIRFDTLVEEQSS
jgi:hypothetical protein